MRGQAAAGCVDAARSYLTTLALKPFGVSSPTLFAARLNSATVRLQRGLPKGARSWGMARKVLNLFLRDSLYNVYLRERFSLERAESLLEIPLDSITAGRLAGCEGGCDLRWPRLVRLEPATSEDYQQVAAREATRMGLARVHLDAYWWSRLEAE
jgi:hypothetical protein